MVYDCFSFFNELDLLKLRLDMLNDVVDRFVLVEARFAHKGQQKPLYFNENKDRYKDYLDKIEHIVVDSFPSLPDTFSQIEQNWANENFQRNAIAKGLVYAKQDDVIIISDLDEIPNPDKIPKVLGKGVFSFAQYFFYYKLNMLNYVSPLWMNGSKMLSYGTFCNATTYSGMSSNPALVEAANTGPTDRFSSRLRGIFRRLAGRMTPEFMKDWLYGLYVKCSSDPIY